MSPFTVRTLTLNPSIDVSSEAEKVEPEKKVRTCCERIDPGGGGINVARVLQRFGISVEAIFLAGGATGKAFDELLGRAGLARRAVWIADDTRTSLTIHEHSGHREFRFVPEGPTVTAEELQVCLEAIGDGGCDYFVVSGSLPPSVPDRFYATVGEQVARGGAKLLLDTSGGELRKAIAAGGIHLLKASKEEIDPSEARQIVESGHAQMVAVTLGRDGAILAGAEGAHGLPSLNVETVSTVGAGDSFLAGMAYGLATGLDPLEAFRVAVAAGAAATLSEGTDLAYPDAVERLLKQVPQPQRVR